MRFSFMSSSHSTVFSLRWLLPLTTAGVLAVGCGGSGGGDVAGGTGGASAQDASTGGEGGSSLAGQGGGGLGGSGGSAATGGEAGSAGASLDGGLDGSGDAAGDAKPDVFIGCPNIGDTQCEGGTVQTCQSDGAGGQDWKTTEFCSVDNAECKVVNGKASCVAAPTCKDGVKNQDETGKDCGGATCDPCPSGEGCVSDGDCESDACANNKCMVCKAGSVRCDCGAVKKCNTQQTAWTTVRQCSASKMCNPDAATCTGQTTVGTNKVTGHYYMYAVFTPSNSPLKSGCYGADSFVDSKGVNWIYINRSGNLDRYQVTIEDSDHDGKVDPNQHPHNPKDTGPMEKRTLIYVDTIPASFGTPHSTGLYATEDAVYYEMNGTVKKFDPKTKQTSTVVATNSIAIEVFGYDSLSKQWFGGQRSRQVYSLCPGKSVWQYEMSYPNMGGSHQDGMEVVTNPKDGISYLYMSDMTSDYILQYYRDKTKNKWTQKNVFQYTDSASQPVEGMGFGAFNHFWISSGSSLYELGGGELQEYVEPG